MARLIDRARNDLKCESKGRKTEIKPNQNQLEIRHSLENGIYQLQILTRIIKIIKIMLVFLVKNET